MDILLGRPPNIYCDGKRSASAPPPPPPRGVVHVEEAEVPAAQVCKCAGVMAAVTAAVASSEARRQLCRTRKAWASEPHLGCSAALRVGWSHWEYKHYLGKSSPGQSLMQVKFIKSWKDLAESGTRAAGTALSHC